MRISKLLLSFINHELSIDALRSIQIILSQKQSTFDLFNTFEIIDAEF
jgi:hypothetical protein